jgi:hypothetical protein
MSINRWTHRATLLLAALAVLLSGCTTYVTTQVTAFSDWSSGDAARTYAFTRAPGQQSNLELSTYERIVANELALHAFREVDSAQARYLVGLSYGMRSDMVTVAQPMYYNPWPSPYWGRSFDPWGPWGPFPSTSVDTFPIFTHLLGVRITERESGKEVYNVTARNSGAESSLVRAMPYLARSAFADFPLGNGEVHTVKIPLGTGGGAVAPVNEVATTGAVPAAAPAAASGAAVAQ